MKLLAKGTRIDGRVRERLLAHKLSKPLESMRRVVNGAGSRRIDQVGDVLLERHPLLPGICGAASGRLLTTALPNLILAPQLDSMLAAYPAQGPSKVEHAVGIALIAAAFAP